MALDLPSLQPIPKGARKRKSDVVDVGGDRKPIKRPRRVKKSKQQRQDRDSEHLHNAGEGDARGEISLEASTSGTAQVSSVQASAPTPDLVFDFGFAPLDEVDEETLAAQTLLDLRRVWEDVRMETRHYPRWP